MTFKIISVGWQCADWLENTLRSIETQTVDDWESWVVYDPSDDNGADRLMGWLATHQDHAEKWRFRINRDRRYAVRNQYEAIVASDPQPGDIIVFLDLDGDQLAHPDVLSHLAEYYADGTLLTYGSYRPVPHADTCAPAVPFPVEVVASGTYRKWIRKGHGCCFNHLRTMAAETFLAIPPDQFHWANGGGWYDAGTDYVFMLAGLEAAGGRYKCIDETLLLYNNANPNADYLYHPNEANACIQDFLRRPKLRPIGGKIVLDPSQPRPVSAARRTPADPPAVRPAARPHRVRGNRYG